MSASRAARSDGGFGGSTASSGDDVKRRRSEKGIKDAGGAGACGIEKVKERRWFT